MLFGQMPNGLPESWSSDRTPIEVIYTALECVFDVSSTQSKTRTTPEPTSEQTTMSEGLPFPKITHVRGYLWFFSNAVI